MSTIDRTDELRRNLIQDSAIIALIALGSGVDADRVRWIRDGGEPSPDELRRLESWYRS